ncbi:MAG: hypothetical protein HY319_02945, partial [Armatimonadetes bacterium]|nr:hypothetical protein [Armatimonadota bacterium]
TADISIRLEFPPPGPPYGGDPLTIGDLAATFQGGSLTATDAQVQGGKGFVVARADVTASVSPDGQTVTGSILMSGVPQASTYDGATTTFTMSRLP